MIQIKFNNKIVMPMRADDPNTFASSDVPHGTDSCIYKAAKILRSQGEAISLPTFTQEEIDAQVADKKALVSMLPLLDEDGEVIRYDNIGNLEFIEPSDEEVKKEFYSNYPLNGRMIEKEIELLDEDGEQVLDDEGNVTMVMTMEHEELKPRTVSKANEMGMVEEAQKYVDEAAAKAALIDDQKQNLAEASVGNAIDNCLVVPILSDDFKNQFEVENVD